MLNEIQDYGYGEIDGMVTTFRRFGAKYTTELKKDKDAEYTEMSGFLREETIEEVDICEPICVCIPEGSACPDYAAQP